MAILAATIWDVRTTGSDTNGGGFNPHRTNGALSAFAGTGTDRSLQDAAQAAFDGATITASNGGTGATITLVGYTVTAADLGNILNITGGTNFTTGRYEITAINAGSNTWTLDRNCTSGAGSALVGNMGGSLLTIAAAVAATVDNNEIHIKSGTYTLTTAVTWASKGLNFYGYNSTHNDEGTAPLITTATNSINLFTPTSGFGKRYSFKNLSMSNTAATRFSAILSGQGLYSIVKCIFDGFRIGGVDCLNGSSAEVSHYRECEIKNCTASASNAGSIYSNTNDNNRYGLIIEDSYIHDGAGHAVVAGITGSGETGVFIHNTIIANHSAGDAMRGPVSGAFLAHITLAHNTIFNVVNGIRIDAPVALTSEANIFDSCSGTAVNWTFTPSTSGPQSVMTNQYNAYRNNGANRPSWLAAGTGDVALTASPFTNTATGDYSLNGTAGGGAACKNATKTLQGSVATYFDIGAVQQSAAGAGSIFAIFE